MDQEVDPTEKVLLKLYNWVMFLQAVSKQYLPHIIKPSHITNNPDYSSATSRKQKYYLHTEQLMQISVTSHKLQVMIYIFALCSRD